MQARARSLRAESTDAERRLWSLLRGRRTMGWKFRRQQPAGPYIVDFVCFERRLIVESMALSTKRLLIATQRAMRFFASEVSWYYAFGTTTS